MLGDIGGSERALVHQQHPGDVERDVAIADDDRPLARQVELVTGVVGMTVVPTDELGGRMVSHEILAVDSQSPAGGRTHRIDHRMVMSQQLVMVDGAADLDVGNGRRTAGW